MRLPDGIRSSIPAEMTNRPLKEHMGLNTTKMSHYDGAREEIQCHFRNRQNSSLFAMEVDAFVKGRSSSQMLVPTFFRQHSTRYGARHELLRLCQPFQRSLNHHLLCLARPEHSLACLCLRDLSLVGFVGPVQHFPFDFPVVCCCARMCHASTAQRVKHILPMNWRSTSYL